MTDSGHEAPEEREDQFQSALLQAIPGEAPGEYIVLGNWNDVPVEYITGFVVAVQSTPQALAWQLLYSIDTWIHAICRMTPTTYMLGTADGELILVGDGERRTVDLELIGGVSCISRISATECWLVHDKGLSRWDGERISARVPTGELHTVHAASPRFAVAVGADGLVLRFDGVDWHEVESVPVNARLIGVFCVSPTEVYVSGWHSVLYRWDGRDSWTRIEMTIENESHNELIFCAVQYQGKIYVCAGSAGLFIVEGNTTRKIQDFYCSDAVVIDDKLVTTGLHGFMEFDGAGWKQATIILPLP